MDELVKTISQKVGITEAQARQAVEMVVDTLKNNLPAPIASQVDAALKGDMDLGGIAGTIGGMFGKK
jgi:uncharacterized protein (DUF2267 family)